MAPLVGATGALVAMVAKVKVVMAVVSYLISPCGKTFTDLPGGGGYGNQSDYGTSVISNKY